MNSMLKRASPAMVVAAIALFVTLSGAGLAATGGNFILGQANTADRTTALTVGTLPDATACPAPCQALSVTNNSTAANAGGLGVLSKSASTPAVTIQNGGGAPALRLRVAPGKAPLVVSSSTKVANLNADLLDGKDATAFLPAGGKAADADKLDGLDSADFVRSSTVRRVGPVVTASPGNYPLALVGNLGLAGHCLDSGTVQEVWISVYSRVDHAAYASLTQQSAGGTFGNADMDTDEKTLAWSNKVASGTGVFVPVTGSVLGADGTQVFYDLYMTQNPRGWTDGRCIFGGSLVVTPPPPAG